MTAARSTHWTSLPLQGMRDGKMESKAGGRRLWFCDEGRAMGYKGR